MKYLKRIIKKIIFKLLEINFIRWIAFWAKSYVLAIDHLKRYPGDFRWIPLSPSPQEKYDAACAQVDDRWYIIGGYTQLNHVCSFVDVFDLKKQRWIGRFDMPVNMAQSHLALTSDSKRFIYAVSGQLGAQCSPAIREGFVYDVLEKSWSKLPPLPEPRYAATMQLWRGRLHVIGGSMADRYTPSRDHWSLAVYEGKAIENNWRSETPIPRGATHRASVLIKDELYVLGGQAGDFIAKPQSLCFECTGLTREDYFAETYRLKSLDSPWERLSDMPVAASHTEFSTVVRDNSVFILGGQVFKDPKTFQLKLTDVVQKFDSQENQWSIVGHLPYGLKTTMVTDHKGWIYFTTGQRDRSAKDPSPDRIDRRLWRARLP